MQQGLLQQTIHSTLNMLSNGVADHLALVGLDGFVDKIQNPVQFQSKKRCVYYKSLSDFGQRVKEASGQSAQIELHTNTVKLGGNAPIYANALAHLAINNICLGTFGIPEIHPVFQKIHRGSQLVSLGNAAETNALEFDDGKLILSELSTFSHLDWMQVKSQVDINYLAEQAAKVQLFGLVDWCNLTHASNIWTGIFEDLVQPYVKQRPHFFFDLADPSKKSTKEVKEVIDIINGFSAFGPVTLGLNENETIRLAGFLGISGDVTDDLKSLVSLGRKLFDFMGIDRLLVHPIDGCISIDHSKELYLEGRLVEHPKVSTGGGDNFNAGFCFGLLNGYKDLESMVCAMATSGAYVQNGRSPDLKALIDYMERWAKESVSG
jgi:hypothetical protein